MRGNSQIAGALAAVVTMAAAVVSLSWTAAAVAEEGAGSAPSFQEVRLAASDVTPIEKDGCPTVYYYDEESTAYVVWRLPQEGVEEFGERFDQEGVSVCTLVTVRALLYGPQLAGSPDVEVVVYQDDGTGLPGAQLAAVTVPNASLPTTGLGWIEADFSPSSLVFSEGETYHLTLRVSPAVAGDTVSLCSDEATGPHSGENRSEYFDGDAWWTLSSAVGTDYVFVFEAEIDFGCDTTCCVGGAGNVNGDPVDKVDVADLTFPVSYLFRGGVEPPCREEANVNGDPDGDVSVSDLTLLVGYLFRGGPAPAPC